MSFAEDLNSAIDEAKEGKRTEEQETRSFEAGWDAARESVVRPVFREAVPVFNQKLGGSEIANRNGSTILLEVGWTGAAFSHSLAFRANKERREVEYSSSVKGDEKEWFTLDALDRSAVESKVRKFAKAIARGKWIDEIETGIRIL